MRRIVADLSRFDFRWAEDTARVLAAGGIAAIPTDAVYALACDITSKKGVERLYQVKGMDRRVPLACMVPDLGSVARYGQVTDYAYRVMRRLLPGPYVIELLATREVPRTLLSRRRTVGIRVPDDAFCAALLRSLGRPVLVTSATGPGDRALGDADAVEHQYGATLDLCVDGGALGELPSTVISLVGDEFVVVRQGKGPIE
jgi:tRNA threonylcarbamoyl adenosine modification protein (Sua5/YciO/YrdC/YwlC family)